jgi:hypothetical protein
MEGHLRDFERRLDLSPILRFFDPQNISNKSIYVETDSMQDYYTLSLLQSILNPSIGSTSAASSAKQSQELITRRLKSSNLASYIIYGVDSNNSKLVTDMLMEASQAAGRLMFVGSRIPFYDVNKLMDRVAFEKATSEFATNLGDKKLRDLGNLRLKKLMRI